MKRFLKVFSCLALAFLWSCAGDSSDKPGAEVASGEGSGSSVIGLNVDSPKISYCFPRYMTDAETRTIWEIFTGDEFNYGKLVIRSVPGKRAGMYFFVMFDWDSDDILMGCKFELSVSSNDNPSERTYVYVVPETSSVLREVALGITGGDWPNPSAKVNAW